MSLWSLFRKSGKYRPIWVLWTELCSRPIVSSCSLIFNSKADTFLILVDQNDFLKDSDSKLEINLSRADVLRSFEFQDLFSPAINFSLFSSHDLAILSEKEAKVFLKALNPYTLESSIFQSMILTACLDIQ